MSYILCIGVKSSIFKRNPILRLSINDYFIDEYAIDSHSEIQSDRLDLLPDTNIFSKNYIELLKNFSILNIEDRKANIPKNYSDILSNDINLRYFEINENIFKTKNKILLEVFNDDNNYTNGFLTKSTFVSLNIVYLAPKDIFLNPDKFLSIQEEKINRIKVSSMKIGAIKNFYKNRKGIFNILKHCEKHSLYSFKKLGTDTFVKLQLNHWIGNTGIIQLSFGNDIIMHNLNDIMYSVDHHLFIGLSNKYKIYENHRSNS